MGGPVYRVQAYQRRGEELRAGEAYDYACEDRAFRRGRAMQKRVEGLLFFKIETSSDGDTWTEIEVLAAAGDVPPQSD